MLSPTLNTTVTVHNDVNLLYMKNSSRKTLLEFLSFIVVMEGARYCDVCRLSNLELLGFFVVDM